MEAKFLNHVDTWRFWIIGFGIVLVIFGAFLWSNWSHTQTSLTKAQQALARVQADEELHALEVEAAAGASYTQCIGSIASTKKINRGLVALKASLLSSQQSTRGALKVQPHGSLSKVRHKSLSRLVKITNNLPIFAVPTKKGCEALRTKILDGDETLLQAGKKKHRPAAASK